MSDTMKSLTDQTNLDASLADFLEGFSDAYEKPLTKQSDETFSRVIG